MKFQDFSKNFAAYANKTADFAGSAVFRSIKMIIVFVLLLVVFFALRGWAGGESAADSPDAPVVQGELLGDALDGLRDAGRNAAGAAERLYMDGDALSEGSGLRFLTKPEAQRWASDLSSLPDSDILDYGEAFDPYANDELAKEIRTMYMVLRHKQTVGTCGQGQELQATQVAPGVHRITCVDSTSFSLVFIS